MGKIEIDKTLFRLMLGWSLLAIVGLILILWIIR
jgi:hypothetical protein